ncbi:helix-turn-helix domain-containing protein [Nocardiopsis sp. FIRDI 009]|uniref:helix-turn-helix domain-containing protein n=1 Tax=Nocardiopsis sp. FIRDI 009 TaxID=714197 RepID=UPI000E24280F|nr:helix-turn-helix domain-containing protein [Nocardiopsis sp. FIRDI 009]
MTDFSQRAREALRDRGLSIRGAARATNYDHGYLVRVLGGKQAPSPQLAAALDDLVDAGGTLAKLASVPEPRMPVPSLPLPSLAPDRDLYERMTSVVEQPRRVDAHAVTWLERCLAEHRRAEDTLGSGPVVGVVRAQLSTVTELGREARPDVRDRLVSLAAQYGQFMAWLCNDQGDKASALAWYDRAHGWAMEAADANMAATTLSMKAHIAWSVGDGPGCVRLGEAARWHDGRTTPGIAGMAAQMQARGHALLVEPDAARRSLDEAETLIRNASEHPEDEPDWMYFYGDTWFLAQRGMVELDLGNGERAVDMLSRALDGLPEHYRRDRAWYRACLATAHAVAGDLDAAADIATDTAGDALAVNAYAVDELRGVASTVTKRAPRVGRDLVDALR